MIFGVPWGSAARSISMDPYSTRTRPGITPAPRNRTGRSSGAHARHVAGRGDHLDLERAGVPCKVLYFARIASEVELWREGVKIEFS